MKCKRCGSTIQQDAKFCTNCGLALEIRAAACPHCWKPINLGKPFCRHCGKPVGQTCPRCNRLARPNVQFCAHCGSKIGGRPPAHPYGTGKLLPGSAMGGDYVIVSKIAQGGMGAVYEVRKMDSRPGRRLAMKEMSFSMLNALEPQQQKIVVEAFRREFELLSSLSHPNLVRAFDYFEVHGRQYYVMEFIDGQTLETVLELEPVGCFLPVSRVLTWARQLCNVLSYLHAQMPPIIYRDLKPSNIMEVRGTKTIKLFDFGIARFYKPGKQSDTLRFGTNGYLAPEVVAKRSQTSAQTDVYALGVLLHQLLTRYDPQIDPFQLPPVKALNPQVPDSIHEAIMHALALNPNLRSRDVSDLYTDLFGSQTRPSTHVPSGSIR